MLRKSSSLAYFLEILEIFSWSYTPASKWPPLRHMAFSVEIIIIGNAFAYVQALKKRGLHVLTHLLLTTLWNTLIVTISQMKKLKHRKLEKLSLVNKTSCWQSQNFNSDYLVSKSVHIQPLCRLSVYISLLFESCIVMTSFFPHLCSSLCLCEYCCAIAKGAWDLDHQISFNLHRSLEG